MTFQYGMLGCIVVFDRLLRVLFCRLAFCLAVLRVIIMRFSPTHLRTFVGISQGTSHLVLEAQGVETCRGGRSSGRGSFQRSLPVSVVCFVFYKYTWRCSPQLQCIFHSSLVLLYLAVRPAVVKNFEQAFYCFFYS